MVIGEHLQRREMFTFGQEAEVVAQQMRGAMILYGDGKRAIVIAARGFSARGIINPVFTQVQDRPPGTITGVAYQMRGKEVLSPNITVLNRGLVMPTQLELPGKGERLRHINSQSAIARELGLEQGVHRTLRVLDPVQGILQLV